jgi:hypothetical protein
LPPPTNANNQATGRCLVCDTDVPVTPKRALLKSHLTPGSDDVCPGSGMRTHGGIRRRSRPRESAHKIGKLAYGLIFTVIAGVLGILSFFGLEPSGQSRSPDPSSQAPDPYLFISFDNSPPARKQQCVGALGLCLWQPIARAIDVFGRTEASGFPRAKSGQEAWLCHGWDPARLKRVVVCEDEGQIAEISVSVPDKSQVSIALPQDVNATLPQMTLAGVAERITDQLDAFPYVMGTLDGEGYWLDSFAWHFISKSEGVPYAIIEITGVEQWGKDAPPRPIACDYPAHLAVTEKVAATGFSVRQVKGSEFQCRLDKAGHPITTTTTVDVASGDYTACAIAWHLGKAPPQHCFPEFQSRAGYRFFVRADRVCPVEVASRRYVIAAWGKQSCDYLGRRWSETVARTANPAEGVQRQDHRFDDGWVCYRQTRQGRAGDEAGSCEGVVPSDTFGVFFA